MKYLCVFVLITILYSVKAITPSDAIKSIDVITSKIKGLETPATAIIPLSGQLIVIGKGPFPYVISGLQDIILAYNTLTANASSLSATPTEQFNITNAYVAQLNALDTLLNVLIGKAALFTTLPINGPSVSAVLRQLKGSFDSNISGFTKKLPNFLSQHSNKKSLVDLELDFAINAYSRLVANSIL